MSAGDRVEGTTSAAGNRICGALFVLIKAVLNYGDALRELGPKRDRISYLEQELESQIKLLAHINDEIIELNGELERLHLKYSEAIAEKKIHHEMLEQAERRVVSPWPDPVMELLIFL